MLETGWQLLARIERVDKSDNETTVNEESSDAQTLNQSNNQQLSSVDIHSSKENNNNNNKYLPALLGLNKKLGMDFENIGGLDSQLDDIARRVLAYCDSSARGNRKSSTGQKYSINSSGRPNDVFANSSFPPNENRTRWERRRHCI